MKLEAEPPIIETEALLVTVKVLVSVAIIPMVRFKSPLMVMFCVKDKPEALPRVKLLKVVE
jgi:hypothetical protein